MKNKPNKPEEPALVFSVQIEQVVTLSFDTADTFWDQDYLRTMLLEETVKQLKTDPNGMTVNLIEVRGQL